MAVRKKQSYWEVDHYLPHGSGRFRRRFKTSAEAEEIDAELRLAILRGNWREVVARFRQVGTELTFDRFADQYFESHVKVHNAATTQMTKKSYLKHLKAYLGSTPVVDIRSRHVLGFIEARKKQKSGNCIINDEVAMLRHMLEWAVDKNFIEQNHLARAKKLMLPEAENEGPKPTDEVIDAILDAIDSRDRSMFVFIRETGCRKSEARTLKTFQIRIPDKVVVFTGKTTKGRRNRYVPLTEVAISALTALPAVSDTVFWNWRTWRIYSKSRMDVVWDEARKNAGAKWMTIHDLRHAYAIRLAEEGCPMHYIQSVLGHSSVAFTEKVYARFCPENAAKKVLMVLEVARDRKEKGKASA